MSKPKRMPAPDVLRLIRRERSAGAYSAQPNGRTALERYGTLFRALESLATISSSQPTELLEVELRAGVPSNLREFAQELGQALCQLTPAGLGALLSEENSGASRDAALSKLQSQARELAGGLVTPAAGKSLAHLLRRLRNAVTHAKLMTSDRGVDRACAAACALVDGLTVASYARVFDVPGDAVNAVLEGRD